jgi:hypothetical protein
VCDRKQDGPKKILGVFFAAHEYAKNPEFLGCAENALGIREWLESKGHKYVVTSDKDGPNSGTLRILTQPWLWWDQSTVRIHYIFSRS